MPVVNSLPFDLFDEDQWFYGSMNRADATELLTNDNETGAFLVRESTTAKGDLVLSVKVGDKKVSHYIINRVNENNQVRFRIGDQIFPSMQTLLNYYVINSLDDTPLKVPANPKSYPIPKRSFTKDYLAEVLTDNTRNTQPETKIVPSSLQRKLPALAKVIQSRIPNAYDKTALTLREGDKVTVTKMDINGCWEGEIQGRKGHFPFNYVKFLEDLDE